MTTVAITLRVMGKQEWGYLGENLSSHCACLPAQHLPERDNTADYGSIVHLAERDDYNAVAARRRCQDC